MGSSSDWDVMQHCVQTLESLGIANERRVLSAHRTPQAAIEWCGGAKGRGLKVIIAAAGGAAHLAGVASAMTPLPVLGVPVKLSETPGSVRTAPPVLGQHTAAVLAELGMSTGTIAALSEAGVLKCASTDTMEGHGRR